ncbi:DEAD/DEAH box helicase [Gorillibacterium sp. sgz5001074]|uniref:DEAD/DEAH box helicase n=1 Tax=Gorillibacterium sp. sgz5001074 TaxID=3446695 RepID=UPI003F6751A8
MGTPITTMLIHRLCGGQSYPRGEAYYREGRVKLTHYDPEGDIYEAEVRGKELYEVRIEFDEEGDADASCTCMAFFSYENHCKHIAATFFAALDRQRKGAGAETERRFPSLLHPAGALPTGVLAPRRTVEPDRDPYLVEDVLELFADKPGAAGRAAFRFDAREVLELEATLKLLPYGYRKFMFGMELKLGPKRLYVVQKIRDTLERIHRRETIHFSKNFVYDPEKHAFRPEDRELLRVLTDVYHSERWVQDRLTPYLTPGRYGGSDRCLMIPPVFWEKLEPLLVASPLAKLDDHGRIIEGIRRSEEPLPVSFQFDESGPDGYRLDVHGLEELTVMEPYGLVLHDGRLLKPERAEVERLDGLKERLEDYRKPVVRIPPGQMEAFMERVVPGLMKLGSVRIAQAVSDRIVRTPLKARLFLDRVKDRLLAGLEFQYGDIVVNPLESRGGGRGNDRILMRDGERERQILELMDKSLFAKTESGYFLDDEEAQYDFLYHTVPELEKVADVLATSAVKVRLHTGYPAPKVKVDVDQRTDWLEMKFDLDGIPEAEIKEVLRSLEEKRRYHKLRSGALLPLETEAFQDIMGVMRELGVRRSDLQGTELRLPALRGMNLMESRDRGDAVKLGKSLRRLLENMRNPDNLDFPVPQELEGVLRDYQRFGFQWLKTLAHYRFGGILADDMGLGKTIQSIGFLLSELPGIRERGMPALIVCPASLVYNWRNELHRFAPDIRVELADGSKADRTKAVKRGFQGHADVLVTSYPLLRRDMELYAGRTFHTLLLDEAQAFKNHATQTAQSVKEVEALHRFALTGTPVENRLEELWSICDTVFPGLFPGRQAFNELPRDTVAKRIRPFLLRRVKADVLKELPDKIETIQAVGLLPEQKKLYAAYLARLQQETLKHLDEEGFGKHRIKILAGLTRLRQLCCHPALFVEGYAGGSSKFEQLLELVEECRDAGKRMLVFSQFTGMLELISRELGYRGVPYFYLDGSTPGAQRVELCSRFNGGEKDVFLISLKAGGTGLNLTGADTVILYDLWWNPAVEQQAADRAHRIGQKNVVQVIRLVTEGTVEDKMYELQQRKKHLIEEVIRPGEEALSSLSEDEIRELLQLA